jgi:hypothetical protein
MSSKKKSAKKRTTRKRDRAMGALLDLLKSRQELVHTLVVAPERVKRLLKSRAARELVAGAEPRMLLRSFDAGGEPGPAGGPDALIVCFLKTVPQVPYTAIPYTAGGSIKAYCMRGTTLFCGRGG